MRISPKINKIYFMALNENRLFRYKLPRRRKKAYIKKYGKRAYNFYVLRVNIKNRNSSRIDNLSRAIKLALASKCLLISCVNTANKFKQLGELLKKNGDILSENLRKNMPNFALEITEREQGIDFKLK